MKRVRIALAALLLPALAPAQEPVPVPRDTTPPQHVPSREVDTAADTTPPPDPAAGAKARSDDRFKPSEKISEDLSVSFPADI